MATGTALFRRRDGGTLMFWPEAQASEMVSHLAELVKIPTEPAAPHASDPPAYAQAQDWKPNPSA